MPATSTLPDERVTIRFPPGNTEESYQLLELPNDILKLVESGVTVPLKIKGRPNDDAVLCTDVKTYALRTVAISNSLLILRLPTTPKPDPTLQIRDVCHEVLECVPAAGRTERLQFVLAESAWGGLGVPAFSAAAPPKASVPGMKRKRVEDDRLKRYTRNQLESIIQASDGEISAALKEQNVVEVDGHMLLLPPAKLAELLSIVLALCCIYGDQEEEREKKAPRVVVSARVVEEALDNDHDVERELSRGVMGLFGHVEAGSWECEVVAMVREVGRGLLVGLKSPRPSHLFIEDWKTATGDTYAYLADLDLLGGDYLLTDPVATAFTAPSPLVSYFPVHLLPMHAATRFSDLFLTRSRWRPEQMIPFMRGLFPAGDTKARDKLVAKFVRVVKEKEGTWWYARRTG